MNGSRTSRPQHPDPRPPAGRAERAVELALRAPSLHNTQPWRWRIADDAVELHADLPLRAASRRGCATPADGPMGPGSEGADPGTGTCDSPRRGPP